MTLPTYRELGYMRRSAWPKTQQHVSVGRPIEVLGLKSRTMTILHYASIRTVEDLCSRTESDLRDVPGLGPTLRADIQKQLKAHSLSLTPSS